VTALAGSGRWSDLGARVASAVVLAGIGIAALWLGGVWLLAFAAALAGLIVWELSVMAGARVPARIAAAAALAVAGLGLLPAGWGLPLMLVPVLAAVGQLAHVRVAHAVFAVVVVLAAYGIVDLRANFAPFWLIWLVAVVVLTDVGGYFAGRLIGGPKFWPAVSPKKTWAGMLAGWLAAAAAGAVGVWLGAAGAELIGVSVALAMAAQLGDIAQSALKRQVGVKDSSQLLPGHGGFFDRFDGMLGAVVLLLVVERLAAFPPAQG